MSPAPSRLAAVARSALIAVCFAVVLTACASKEAPLFCPLAVQVHDASYLARFAGEGRDLTDMLFEAELVNVVVLCEIDEGEESADVEVEVVVTIQAVRGLADQDREANLNYFVAIADPNRTILVRDVFDMTVPFEGNRTRAAVEDRLETEFVVPAAADASGYRVYVGLELTPEEVQSNRGRR